MHYGVVRSGRRHGRNERDNPEGDTIHKQSGRRVIFKNLMEGVFLSLYDKNREMYEGLERRIKEELDYDKNRYYVKTGIVEREFSMPPTICCHQWMKVIWQKNCMI